MKGFEAKETQKNFIQVVEQDNAPRKNNLCENNLFSSINNSTNFGTENNSIGVKAQSEIFNNIVEKSKFNSLIFFRTSVELNKTNSHVTEFQNTGTSNDAKSDIEIIEVWNNNKVQKTKLYENLKRIPTKTVQYAKCKNQSNINHLAFELWKKQKNIKYKQLLMQKEKEKQEKLQAKLKEIESKRATQTYIRIKKRGASQQKRKLAKEIQVSGQSNIKSLDKQTEMKRIINDKVFKEWKRQKDIKLREQKITNKTHEQYGNHFYYRHQQQTEHTDFLQSIDTKFDFWLNQLDWVLHEKYLRERRYLVRSFYCQPAYYGNAADIVYAKYM